MDPLEDLDSSITNVSWFHAHFFHFVVIGSWKAIVPSFLEVLFLHVFQMSFVLNVPNHQGRDEDTISEHSCNCSGKVAVCVGDSFFISSGKHFRTPSA